jgi:hypothetical protein
LGKKLKKKRKTAEFTREALEYTPKNETKIILIDGIQDE